MNDGEGFHISWLWDWICLWSSHWI